MNILVTGSHGFIGTELCKVFEERGDNVTSFDLKIDKHTNQIDSNFLATNSIDLIVHLAAFASVRESFDDPDRYLTNNFVETKRIFDAASVHDIPVIWASSSTSKKWWLNPYASSKRYCEALQYKHSLGLRFTTVYGETSRQGMFFEKLINDKLEYLTIHKRDFVHIDDVINATIKAMNITDMFDGSTYDIGTGSLDCLDDVYKHYYDIDEVNIPIVPGKSFEQVENVASIKDTSKLLGWEPKFNSMIDYINYRKKC